MLFFFFFLDTAVELKVIAIEMSVSCIHLEIPALWKC